VEEKMNQVGHTTVIVSREPLLSPEEMIFATDSEVTVDLNNQHHQKVSVEKTVRIKNIFFIGIENYRVKN